MTLIILAGLPGSGKTTVQNVAVGEVRPATRVTTITYGDLMFEIARRGGLVENRDEMRQKIPRDKYVELQEQAAQEVAKTAAKRNVILNTHLAMKTSAGLIPGLPMKILGLLDPARIVIIEADPKDIEARQKSDASRERGDFGSAAALAELQQYCRYCAAAYSVAKNIPVRIIVNRQGRIREAARELAEVLKDVF